MDAKVIDGLGGRYSVSQNGEVFSQYKGDKEPLKPKMDGGRLYVALYDSEAKKYRRFSVDKLVAAAYLDNPFNYTYLRHVDVDSANCAASNLMWVKEKRCLLCESFSPECSDFSNCVIIKDRGLQRQKQLDEKRAESLPQFQEALDELGGVWGIRSSYQSIAYMLQNGDSIEDVARKCMCSIQYVYRVRKLILDRDPKVYRKYQ